VTLPESESAFEQWVRGASLAAPEVGQAPGRRSVWAQSRASSPALKTISGVFVLNEGRRGAERLVGFIGIEEVAKFGAPCIWYGFDKAARGLGLAKTGVMAAMADFAEFALERGRPSPSHWVLHTLKRNVSSARLAASLGFGRDEQHDYVRSRSARGGQRFDGYSLIRSGASLRSESNARLAGLEMSSIMARVSAPAPSSPLAKLRARGPRG
jgi:RimJ/RimL family protein N-acetyltransferase